jgi:hypothetical protein
MASAFLDPREKWPYLICGPMLRRVTPEQVAVFVATSESFTARLRVRLYAPTGDWKTSAIQETIRLIGSLYALVILLTLPVAAPLALETVYEYDVQFTVTPSPVFDKFADHLSLNRQEGIFSHARYATARSTLSDWVGACGVQSQPLVDALRQVVLQHEVLHADETPVAKPGNCKTHRAYLWAKIPGLTNRSRRWAKTLQSRMQAITSNRSSRTGAESWFAMTTAATRRSSPRGVFECGCLAHVQKGLDHDGHD